MLCFVLNNFFFGLVVEKLRFWLLFLSYWRENDNWLIMWICQSCSTYWWDDIIHNHSTSIVITNEGVVVLQTILWGIRGCSVSFLVLLLLLREEGEVECTIYLSICWSYRMAVLMLGYHSIASYTYNDDISASAMCHLYRFGFSLHI